MLQHQRKDLGLLGLALDDLESVCLICKIKSIVHGNKKSSDVSIVLKLLENRLGYNEYHMRISYRTRPQKDHLGDDKK